MHILFVCTGNICRSPTAERLAQSYCSRSDFVDLTASSAGTRAVIGHPIHRDAAVILKQLGGSASDFTARHLTPRIAADADLVLTMTESHRDTVLELAPRQLRRTFTMRQAARLVSLGARDLTELAELRPLMSAREDWDIPDPIGQSPMIFAAVGAEIAELLPPILRLCHVSAEQRPD